MLLADVNCNIHGQYTQKESSKYQSVKITSYKWYETKEIHIKRLFKQEAMQVFSEKMLHDASLPQELNEGKAKQWQFIRFHILS